MHSYDYVVWSRNLMFPRGDQDGEWPACFIVVADTPTGAKSWGDHLHQQHLTATQDVFMWSKVEPHVCESIVEPGTMHRCPLTGTGASPVVVKGDVVSKDFIGW